MEAEEEDDSAKEGGTLFMESNPLESLLGTIGVASEEDDDDDADVASSSWSSSSSSASATASN